MRRPPVVLGMAAITALALLVAVGLILFQVNPQQDSNARNLNNQQRELAIQVRDINAIICSQAQTTANAYRFRSLTPSGAVEPIRHFLTRMQAQKQTLQLSRGRDCAVAPGFPPFEYQLTRALAEINAILMHFSAKQREPVRRGISRTPQELVPQPDFGVPSVTNPDKSGKAGVGDEGVPYLPSHQGDHEHSQPQPAPKPPEATRAQSQPRASGHVEVPASSGDRETAPEPVPTKPSALPAVPSATEVTEAIEEAADAVEEPLCTAIREVHNLC